MREIALSPKPFHLFRYIDEQAFRFNIAGQQELIHDGATVSNDALGDRWKARLYKELTAKTDLPAEPF
ncbi:MAG TPA: hypothetical protein VI636_16795 [Candidatus Angelobacter sp.]